MSLIILYIDNNIKVEYLIKQDINIGLYQGILTSTNGKDLKSETYINKNLELLQKNLKIDAENDFNHLKLER